MNINAESHFSKNADVRIPRSTFVRDFKHTLTADCGDLIPFFWDEMLPGDTFKIRTSLVARLQTLLSPIMDNLYLDYRFFFVPNRLTWTHWKEFMGENTESAWIPETEYTVPRIYPPDPNGTGWQVGTIADYLGVRPGTKNQNTWISALPFRAYALICDQWWRDENLSDPLYIDLGDSAQIGSNGSNYVTDVANGGKPFKASKFHDMFTSCLPSPQKSDPVSVSFASINNFFPTGTLVNSHDDLSTPSVPMRLRPQNGVAAGSNDHYIYYESGNTRYRADSAATPSQSGTTGLDERPVNLWTKVDYSSDLTINELRMAFQLQKYYEKNARGGSRYRELIRSHFGVSSPDARMMIPEYLGGKRVPLQISQVTNTAQSATADLGDLGGQSNTASVSDDVFFSASEHGIIMGVFVVRYDHSYPQGLSKAFTRKSKLDYFWPVFSCVGEMPVRKKELFLSDDPTEDDKVFGYQEAWAEYRYPPTNRCSGEMRPDVSNTLASWHLADNYSQSPSLSDAWIREDKNIVDRVLAVGSDVSQQIFADFLVRNIATRPLPVTSIPGLVDHF